MPVQGTMLCYTKYIQENISLKQMYLSLIIYAKSFDK